MKIVDISLFLAWGLSQLHTQVLDTNDLSLSLSPIIGMGLVSVWQFGPGWLVSADEFLIRDWLGYK